MLNPSTLWTSEQGNGTVSLGTLGLGSTLGLVIVAGVGLRSNDRNGRRKPSSAGTFAHVALDNLARFLVSVRDLLKHPKVIKIFHALAFACLVIWVVLECLAILTWRLLRATLHWKENFRNMYGEFNWRNFSKFLLIFKIWEPLPYDLMVGREREDLMQEFEDTRIDGSVGVCLRFRMGPVWDRAAANAGARSLHGRYLSVPAYLPLEEDGSLRVDLIREKFCIEEVDLFVPGHWRSYRMTKGNVISPIMLNELVQEFNSVNAVEYEDLFCLHRRRFRQWLRSTRLHYLIRISAYFFTVFFIGLVGFLVGMYLSSLFPGKLWWCFCNSVAIYSSAVAIAVFFEYRRMKYEVSAEMAWHTFPRRYSAYWLNNKIKGRFL